MPNQTSPAAPPEILTRAASVPGGETPPTSAPAIALPRWYSSPKIDCANGRENTPSPLSKPKPRRGLSEEIATGLPNDMWHDIDSAAAWHRSQAADTTPSTEVPDAILSADTPARRAAAEARATADKVAGVASHRRPSNYALPRDPSSPALRPPGLAANASRQAPALATQLRANAWLALKLYILLSLLASVYSVSGDAGHWVAQAAAASIGWTGRALLSTRNAAFVAAYDKASSRGFYSQALYETHDLSTVAYHALAGPRDVAGAIRGRLAGASPMLGHGIDAIEGAAIVAATSAASASAEIYGEAASRSLSAIKASRTATRDAWRSLRATEAYGTLWHATATVVRALRRRSAAIEASASSVLLAAMETGGSIAEGAVDVLDAVGLGGVHRLAARAVGRLAAVEAATRPEVGIGERVMRMLGL